MPELPEVETVREGLAGHVVGRTVAAVEVHGDRLGHRILRHQGGGVDEFVSRLRGRSFAAVVRRGKFLWLPLAEHDGAAGEALLAHLGMSGQFRIPAEPDQHRQLRVRLRFADGGVLDFYDQRTFGYLTVADLEPTADGEPGGHGDPLPRLPAPAANIARDLLDPLRAAGTAGRRELVETFQASRRGVKGLLLDQNLISGVGNIYADEALWRARVHYATPGTALSRPRLQQVLEDAADVMRRALAVGGTSFDSLYVNVNGASGYFSRSLHVYGRQGQPCDRCGTNIVRESFMNRGSHFCPRCQQQC
ncbi:MAG: bifunctional DNA-formamidopyrimidine glycosylase/DNA-(apurinic or apyrimidinic site) lyase, partial [Beutenbergiaceae bacterium]